MYRTLIPCVLFIATTAAPQNGGNSEITYVKIQHVTEENPPLKSPFRESRIENLPLTIPGTVNSRSFGQVKSIYEGENQTNKFIRDEIPASSEDGPSSNDSNTTLTENRPIHAESKPQLSESSPLLPENSPEIPKNVSPDNQRKIRSEETTEPNSNETLEPTDATEGAEELIAPTEAYETRTKAPSLRFLSKLSYFQKDDELRSSIATNLVERPGKRRFKSKCRCEKIWNCPKLQITVPRCPNEYFMCCF